MSKTQNETVLDWLKGKNSITALEAFNRWGISRLGARVYDLKNMGHKIQSEMVEVNNRFGDKCRVARYYLDKKPKAEQWSTDEIKSIKSQDKQPIVFNLIRKP